MRQKKKSTVNAPGGRPMREVSKMGPGGRIIRHCLGPCDRWLPQESRNFHSRKGNTATGRRPGWSSRCKRCEAERARKDHAERVHEKPLPVMPLEPPPILGWCWWEPTAWNPEHTRKRP